MAAPTIFATATGNANNTSVSVTYPASIQADDYLILWLCKDADDTTTTAPTGYTYQSSYSSGIGSCEVRCFTKKATGSESGTVSVSWSGFELATLSLFVVRGVDTTTPIDSSGTSFSASNTATVTVTGFTPTQDDCMLIGLCGSEDGQSTHTLPNNTNANFAANEDFDFNDGTGSGVTGASQAGGHYAQSTATATGNMVFTQTNAQEYGAIVLALAPAAAGGDVTLTGAAGSYTYTGVTADLLADPVVGADAGSYSYTGVAADFTKSRNLTSDAGVYSQTGVIASLLKDSILTANAGVYTYTGVAADLTKSKNIIADAGSYTQTGVAASLLNDQILTGDAGSYTQTGIDASLLADKTVTADVGSYAYSGVAADLTKSINLTGDAGSYAQTGVAASLLADSVLTADAGSYSYTGVNANLIEDEAVVGAAGSYSVGGVAASFTIDSTLTADAGSYSVSGVNATLTTSTALTAAAGSYGVTGVSASLSTFISTLVLKNRVREKSATSGTGTLTLDGVYNSSFQTFNAAIGDNNTTYYTITLEPAGEWEVGHGTVSGNTLSRDTVFSSSNAGSLVNFSGGTKDVFVMPPAERCVVVDAAPTEGQIPVYNATNDEWEPASESSALDGTYLRLDCTNDPLTADLDLNDNNLNNVNNIQFTLSPSHTHAEGSVHWNDDDKTLNIDTEVSGVEIQVGQESVIRCTNKTGVLIEKGKVVYISGAQGSRPTIALADASSGLFTDATIGVVSADIADNGTGYVTTFGLLRDLDTSAFTAGDVLYISTTAGGITNSAPTAPDHRVQVGVVLFSNISSGIIYVQVRNGEHLEYLHDVAITSVADNDLLQYNSGTGNWENQTLATVGDGTYLRLDTTNDPLTGGLTIDGTVDEVQLTVQAHSTQTNNLTEWQNSSSTTLAQIDSDGHLTITPGADAVDALLINNNAGNPVLQVDTTNRRVGINDASPDGALDIQLQSSTETGIIIDEFTTQTSETFKIQNNAEDAYLVVNGSGSATNSTLEVYHDCVQSDQVTPVNNDAIFAQSQFTGSGGNPRAGIIINEVANTTASAGLHMGVNAVAWYTGSANLTAGSLGPAIQGGRYACTIAGTGTTIESAAALEGVIQRVSGTTTITDGYGVYIEDGTNCMTNMTAYYAEKLVGTSTNYGLYINDAAFIDGGEDATQLVVQGHSAQTNNLTEWQNSSGTNLVEIDPSGNLLLINDAFLRAYIAAGGTSVVLAGMNTSDELVIGTSAASLTKIRFATNAKASGLFVMETSTAKGYFDGKLTIGLSFTNNDALYVRGIDTNRYVLTVQGTTGQTQDIFRFNTVSANFFSGDSSGQMTMTSLSAGNTPLTIKGATSQTGTLQEWQNSSGTLLSGVNGNGRFGIGVAPSDSYQLYVQEITDGATPATFYGANFSVTSNSGAPGNLSTLNSQLIMQNATATSNAVAHSLEVKTQGFAAASQRIYAQRVSAFANVASGEVVGTHYQTWGTNNASGSTALTKAIDIETPTTTGTVTEARAINIEDITGATTNYAVKTGAGRVDLGASIQLPIETVTASSDTLDTTNHTVLCDCTSNNITINLPAASGNSGLIYNIKKIDSSSNTVTVDGNASETIDGATTQVISSQYDCITVQCDGSAWYII